VTEARVLIEGWPEIYNTSRPHQSLGMRTPAAFAADIVAKPKEGK
jgi:transposase InsO family protein